MVHPHPVRKCIGGWWLHQVVIAFIGLLKCSSVEFMDWTLICRQNFHLIKNWGIKILEDCSVKWSISRDSIGFLFSLVDWTTWVNSNYRICALKYNIISRSFNKCYAFSSWNRMPTKLPRWDLQYVIAKMIFNFFVWVGKLINVIPQWIFTPRNWLPPSLQSFLVFGSILLIFFQLKNQIIGQHCLLLVRVMNIVHYMPSHFLLTVILGWVQVK
jgi:hypothetical protein